MPSRPIEVFKPEDNHTANFPIHNTLTQHGTQQQPQQQQQDQLLLGLPNETLTHISAYLDPPALLALAQSHRVLNDHLKNDHTWYRAFLRAFLDVGPDSDIDEESTKTAILRRSESTWRKEYSLRYILTRFVFATFSSLGFSADVPANYPAKEHPPKIQGLDALSHRI